MAIPVYERRESIKPLPEARMRAEGGMNAYGAGAGSAITHLGEAGLKLLHDYEDAETLEAYNNFKRDVSLYHNSPEKGVLNRQGKNAKGLFQEADLWMQNKAEEYAKKMKSSRMTGNFRKMAAQTIAGQGEHNSRFEAAQYRNFRNAQADAAVETAFNEAAAHWDDENAVEAARQIAIQALVYKHRDDGEEVFKNALAEWDNKTASAQLSAMAQAGPMAAEAWYKEHKDRFAGEGRIKAEALLERETRAYKVEIARDGLVKRHGMNYAAARQEILEKYRGDEEKQILSAYEAFYSDRKRIQEMAEQQAEDNFFRKLQSFESEEEAVGYLIKNARTMGQWQNGKSLINFLFNARRKTQEGALLDFYEALEAGEYNNMTASQLRAAVGSRFSKDDFDNDALWAFNEWKGENKARERDITKILSADLKKERERAVKKYGADTAALLEREYRRYVKENPNSGPEERRAEYRRLAGSRVLYDHPVWGVRDSEINEAEARNLERMGYFYNRGTDSWINKESGRIIYKDRE